jgi:hypothetical protein
MRAVMPAMGLEMLICRIRSTALVRTTPTFFVILTGLPDGDVSTSLTVLVGTEKVNFRVAVLSVPKVTSSCVSGSGRVPSASSCLMR